MTPVLARLLICMALVCSPFVLVALASRKAQGCMWMSLFPIFGGVPAVLGALLVFAPLERYLDARALGHLKNVAVPVAGAFLVVIFILVIQGATGSLKRTLGHIARDRMRAIEPILVWSALGVLWGVLWRLSDWLATRAGVTGTL